MIESGLDFILLIIATFRLTRLLVYDKITSFIRDLFIYEYEETLEDGNEEIYIETKGRGIQKLIGELLSCYWCTGIWCALFIYAGYILLPTFSYPIIVILAVAGSASYIEAILLKLVD